MSQKDSLDDWSVGWYCLRAKPRMENVASATLSTLDSIEVFLPRTIRPQKAFLKTIPPCYFHFFLKLMKYGRE